MVSLEPSLQLNLTPWTQHYLYVYQSFEAASDNYNNICLKVGQWSHLTVDQAGSRQADDVVDA